MIPMLLRPLLAGAHRQVRFYCLRILLASVTGLVAAMGLAMLVGSAFLGLADVMPAPAAAAVTGGGLLAFAGLCALIAPRLGRRRSRPAAAGGTDRLAAAAAALGHEMRTDPTGLAVTALLLGCAVGASPELRRVIAGLLRPPLPAS